MVKPGVIEEFTEHKKMFNEAQEGAQGFVLNLPKSNVTVLWLKVYDIHWECMETLIHELHHAVYIVLGKNRSMADEMEALAYQQEFLFRSIRQHLSDKLL